VKREDMKVLAILTGEMCFDGITNSVYNYYNAMDRSDMEIGIVSARSTNKDMKAKFEALGCKVFPLENRDKATVRYIINLIKIIRKGGYDIVHAHGNSATLAFEMVAAKIAGCKVRIIHSRNSSCEHVKVDKLLRPIMYATYTDGFACGEKAGKWLFGKRPFTIMNNGKDIDRFLFNKEKREEYREKLNAIDGEILLGHVGLFHRQKNHDYLLDIFRLVCEKKDNYRLVLIGEGEEKHRIEEKVESIGLSSKVVFLGQQSNVEDWLQAMDIMVFPSLFEGMPNVVLEWQISGLPVFLSSEITRECKIMDNIKFLSIKGEPSTWADLIVSTRVEEREGKQASIRKAFENAGFDIKTNAKLLRKKYEEMYRG
jgi:glycosyltransferase involved in cell wall biosynthesis